MTNDGSDGTSTYVEADDLATVATSGSYNDLSNKPTIPTVNNATLTVQKNGTSVGTFTANSNTNTEINITVPTSAADVSALPASTKYGASISVSINTTNYQITTTLKDQDGNTLGTAQTIDLPLESVVVNGTYDSTNKKIILTLQNGNTIDIPVSDLVSGLQAEITSSNKLSADLVDDTSTTHKFTTAAEKTKLSGIATGAQVNVIETVKVNGTALTVSSKAVDVPVPTQTSDLTNNGSDGTSTYVEADDLATVATSGSYNDLSNKPTIPTVNNGTLTIQRNTTTVGTFTANQSGNTTVDITVPTKTSDLTNDSGFITSADVGVTSFNGATGAIVYHGIVYIETSDLNLATYSALAAYISAGSLPIIIDGTNLLYFANMGSSNELIFHPIRPTSATYTYRYITSDNVWHTATAAGLMLQGDMVALTNAEIDAICV